MVLFGNDIWSEALGCFNFSASFFGVSDKNKIALKGSFSNEVISALPSILIIVFVPGSPVERWVPVYTTLEGFVC